MGRKNQSILNELIMYPWWVNVSLAVIVYVLSVFIVPFIPISNLMVKGMISGAAFVGPYVSLILLLAGGASAFFVYRKGRQLENQTNIESIRNLSWRRFESLVSEVFRRQGYTVLDNIDDGPDGGVDIVLRKDGQVVFVQCKHWKSKQVGVKIVRELLGSMASKKVDKGIVATFGGFTQEARDFARSNSIQLIDGNELARLIGSVQKNGNMELNQQKQKSCPKCGKELVLRVAKKGPRAGGKFWGCSGFPDCRYTATEMEN